MVIINMENAYSTIQNLSSNLINSINDKLSYMVGGFGQPTEQKFLYDQVNNRTYTGLVPYILSILIKKGIKYQLNDLRQKHKSNADFKVNKDFEARDYQQDIIDRASSREILQAATGAGL